MRSGGYGVVQQGQALVEEAAAAVWQAANLARRRGHAQVTPLHVASAMLSSDCMLRAACLRSSSHPLRPEALQLCLDIALSRLPMAWPPAAAMFRHHGAPVMTLSNALVAALKRAQAHERRGSAEGGQRQPTGLAVKVGLEQLVVSILDDPSVDRAMREAGFSGSQVKAIVQKGASSEQPDSVHSHCSDAITSPWPVSKNAMAGQTSAGTVWDMIHRPVVVPDRSLASSLSCYRGGQLCQPKPIEGCPAFFDLTEGTTSTASLPSWLHRQQDVIPTCRNTGLQQKFIEVTSDNLKILCDVLEQRVPWQKDIVPAIAATVLRCRSGMMRRQASSSMAWLLFRGKDVHAKREIAQELAKLLFGSYSEFTVLSSGDTSSHAGDLALKRRRSPDVGSGYVGIRLFEAIIENPHRVVFINDVDQLDHASEMAIKNVIETGRIMGCKGAGITTLEDAIVVLSSEASEPRPLAAAPPPTKRRRIGGLNCEEGGTEKQVESRRFVFDLNARMEDVEEEEEETSSAGSAGIMGVVDGVFHFN